MQYCIHFLEILHFDKNNILFFYFACDLTSAIVRGETPIKDATISLFKALRKGYIFLYSMNLSSAVG